jgi:hypothetical protein
LFLLILEIARTFSIIFKKNSAGNAVIKSRELSQVDKFML